MPPPKLIAIDPDEHRAKHVGWTADRHQVFITTPFVPATPGDPGREFLAVFLFDDAGTLTEARIDDLGPRSKLDERRARELSDQRLADVGEVSVDRIEIAPFEIERFGVKFGLIAAPPEEDDHWVVELHPGNYMAFYEPWDSGDYDT